MSFNLAAEILARLSLNIYIDINLNSNVFITFFRKKCQDQRMWQPKTTALREQDQEKVPERMNIIVPPTFQNALITRVIS